jgi:hypothetical protein
VPAGEIIVTLQGGKKHKGRGTLSDANTSKPYLDYAAKPYPSKIDFKTATNVQFKPDMGRAVDYSKWEYFFQGQWVGPRLVLKS